MEKNLNASVVKFNKGKIPSRSRVNIYDHDLLLEEEDDSMIVQNDLSELDDLVQIYGEMDEIL
jgi:hypothetical protein